MALPNCKYCGKFCDPKKHNVVSEDVYGHMGVDTTVFYHIECKEKKMPNEQKDKRSVATKMP